jgi:hypothetical protein
VFWGLKECGDALMGIGGEIKTLVYTKEFVNSLFAHNIL